MAKNLPARLTQQESRQLAGEIDNAVMAFCLRHPTADRAVVEQEMAMHCGRYAINHGILDPLPETHEADDQGPAAAGPDQDRQPVVVPRRNAQGARRGRP